MPEDKLKLPSKLPILVLIGLIVISLSLAGNIFHLLQKERARSLSLQGELEELRSRQKAAELKLKESGRFISELQSKLEQTKIQIDTLNADLRQEKTAKEETLTKVEQLKIDLEQREGLRSDLEKKFSEAQKEIQNLQAQVKELGVKKAGLETKLKDLEAQTQAQAQAQGIELGTIVVSPEPTLPQAEPVKSPKEKPKKPVASAKEASLEGKVLVVNKDYNFAVITLGSKDGLEIGNIFSVYHNNKYIGDISVEKIYDSMSAAGFTSGDLKDKINEGDKVVRKSK